MGVTTERQGDIAILTMADWSGAGLDTVLDAALTEEQVRVVVLRCAAEAAPAPEADGPDRQTLLALCDKIETAAKPVIAVLHGEVSGTALELALACHYRVGAEDLRIAAPGVRLGLTPFAGATQRLPRLCGAGDALALFLTGTPRPPMAGFLDAPETADTVAEALALAARVTAPRPTRERDTGLRDAAGFMAAVARAREAQAESPILAPRRIVGCVEAAILLPFEAGLALELAAHDDCAFSPAARALRHISDAESGAWDLPAAVAGQPVPVERVAILGGTAHAGDMALACLDAGYEVLLVELEPAGQAEALDRLLGLYDAAVARGALSAETRDSRLMRVNPEASFEDMGTAGIVWETVPEDDAELKQELWSAIGLLTRPDAVLLASGSKTALGDLAIAADCAERVVGVALRDAVGTGTLAEIVPAPGCTADAMATALLFLRRLGRQAVAAPDRPGRLLGVLREALEQAVGALLVGGHTAETIDEALLDYGFRQPPCLTLDIRGLDRALADRVPGTDDTLADAAFLELLADSGLSGRAAGAGLYLWKGDRPQGEPPATRVLLDALSEAGAPAAQEVPSAQIAHLCAAALADAGAALVLSGPPGLSAGDIDVAAVHGLGFPRWRGGPMMAADQRGLLRTEKDLIALGLARPPSPMFETSIKSGGRFADLAAPFTV